MAKLVGHNRGDAALERTQFIAQLYVNRRKVWEGRATTHEEAAQMAKREKAKYPGTKSTTVIKERGEGGYDWWQTIRYCDVCIQTVFQRKRQDNRLQYSLTNNTL